MRRSLLLLACLCLSGTSQARTFEWAIVDPLDIVTNPTWLQSSLDLTPAGEPVRAHLVRNRALVSFHYLGGVIVCTRPLIQFRACPWGGSQ